MGFPDYVLQHGVCYDSERQKDYEFHDTWIFRLKRNYGCVLVSAWTLPRSPPKKAYSSSESKGMCFQLFAFSVVVFALIDPRVAVVTSYGLTSSFERSPAASAQVNWTMAVLGQPKPVPPRPSFSSSSPLEAKGAHGGVPCYILLFVIDAAHGLNKTHILNSTKKSSVLNAGVTYDKRGNSSVCYGLPGSRGDVQ